MPNTKVLSPLIVHQYDDLYELRGAVLDKDSYQKHTAAAPVSPEASVPAEAARPFDAPQDLHQIAAQAFDADRQAEYRPETACFAVYVPQETSSEEIEEVSSVCVQTQEVYRPEEMKIIVGNLTTETIVQRGSTTTSQHSSASVHITSGSFLLGSGSFRVSSYTLKRFTSSWHSSFRTSASRSSSFYSHVASLPAENKPYMGSLNWDSELCGYGIHLI